MKGVLDNLQTSFVVQSILVSSSFQAILLILDQICSWKIYFQIGGLKKMAIKKAEDWQEKVGNILKTI